LLWRGHPGELARAVEEVAVAKAGQSKGSAWGAQNDGFPMSVGSGAGCPAAGGRAVQRTGL